MIQLVLFCSFVIFAANGLPQDNQLTESIKYQPYTVALKYKNKYTCNGAIISPTKILTTANCVISCLPEAVPTPEDCKNFMTVVTGSSNLSSGGNVYRIKTIKVHHDSVIGKLASDVAVITLTSAIEYSEKEQPIGLPEKDIVEDTTAVTSGWGIKSVDNKLTDNLGSYKRNIVTAAKCNVKYFKNKNVQVDVNDFCGVSTPENPGFCEADSGSPLVQDGKIIGISAWGLGCARKFPAVYTNVYKYLEFIKEELE